MARATIGPRAAPRSRVWRAFRGGNSTPVSNALSAANDASPPEQDPVPIRDGESERQTGTGLRASTSWGNERRGATPNRPTNPNGKQKEFCSRPPAPASPLESIILAPPPAVLEATLTIAPPDYAIGRIEETETNLGSGFGPPSTANPPSLPGSRVRLSLHLNKPLPIPQTDRDEWLSRTLSWENQPLPQFSASGEKQDYWELNWTLADSRLLKLHLTDEHGLTNHEPIIFRLDAVADALPTVTITDPPTDEDVLATAIIPLRAEARDDVALSMLGFEARVKKSEAPLPSADSPEVIASPDWRQTEIIDRKESTLTRPLPLPDLKVKEGDTILVTAIAQDGYLLEGQTHPLASSPVRVLRVIGDLELSSRLRRELGTIRQNAIRIESQQQELQDDIQKDGIQPGVSRAQARITERIAAQREGLQEIQSRAERNQLDDDGLDTLLAQSTDILDHAGQAANRAGEGIEKIEDDPQTPSPKKTEETRQEIADRQQDVRDELTDLIKLLDRDEDTWVVTRQLESLLDEQIALEEESESLGQRTLGRSRNELGEDDRTALDRIAEKQRDLRDQSQKLTDEMHTRAEALEEVDASSASGMRQAAETAERRDLERDMENAADRVEQNRMQNARQAQASARQTMQRMLQDMQENQQARAEELLRKLASLQESIERLVRVQENELISLATLINAANDEDQPEAMTSGGIAGGRGMVRLHQNTLGVSLEARQAGQETRRIARALDRAADAQSDAISALRETPPAPDRAQAGEERSLELLKEALQLAEELEKKTEEEEAGRRREELIEAYRAFAEQQIVIREETLILTEPAELDRRQLVEARRLGTRQDDLRTGLLDLRDTTPEILDAPVFTHIHKLIDRWARESGESLMDGKPTPRITNLQQRIAAGLGRLIEALEESQNPPDEFAQENQGENSSGGSGSPPEVIPPIAELKLLHGLQELVYEQTRSLDGSPNLHEALRRDQLRELGQEQQDIIELGRQMLEKLQQQESKKP